MNVLHIDGSGTGKRDDHRIAYGVGTHVVELNSRLEERGVSTSIASSSIWILDRTTKEGPRGLLVPGFREKLTIKGLMAPANMLTVLDDIDGLVQRADLVHVHITAGSELVLGYLIGKRYDVPVVCTIHTYLLFKNPLYKIIPFSMLLNGYDGIVVISKELFDLTSEHRKDGVHCIHNGVDITPRDVVQRKGIVVPIRLFGMNAKVVRLFLDAYQGIVSSLGKHEVTFIGDGPLHDEVHDRLRRIDEGRCRHVRSLEPMEMLKVLGEAKLSMCSGRTAIESLCLGTPTMLFSPNGYLSLVDSENFERAAYSNFSGRGLSLPPNAEELGRDILAALDRDMDVPDKMLNEFHIDHQVDETIKFYYQYNKLRNLG